MSIKITEMNPGQALSANLMTGMLVVGASLIGVPVSTTHVSVGALFGIGLVSKKANISVISSILMSWIITLPCAAIFAAVAYWVMESTF